MMTVLSTAPWSESAQQESARVEHSSAARLGVGVGLAGGGLVSVHKVHNYFYNFGPDGSGLGQVHNPLSLERGYGPDPGAAGGLSLGVGP